MGCCETYRASDTSEKESTKAAPQARPNQTEDKVVQKPVVLHYLEVYGRAEVIRLTLTLAGVTFTNDFLPFNGWQEHVESYPFAQIPMLEIDGKELTGSVAILRYLCQKYGFYPPLTDSRAVYRCEAICEFVDSCRTVLLQALKEGGVRQTRAYKESVTSLASLDAQLPEDAQYLVGQALSMADLMCVDFLWNNYLSQMKRIVHEQKVPERLRTYVATLLHKHDEIRLYLDSRPKRPA